MRTDKAVARPRAARRVVTKTTANPWNRTGASNLKQELSTWLCNRTIWNHEDWTKLLSDLRTKGFSDLVDTPRGQDAIGLYLETHRKFPNG